jgi:hypothetical protein
MKPTLPDKWAARAGEQRRQLVLDGPFDDRARHALFAGVDGKELFKALRDGVQQVVDQYNDCCGFDDVQVSTGPVGQIVITRLFDPWFRVIIAPDPDQARFVVTSDVLPGSNGPTGNMAIHTSIDEARRKLFIAPSIDAEVQRVLQPFLDYV